MQSRSSSSLGNIFFAIAVVAAAMVLSFLIDNNLGMSWPSNVVRNWQDFGFLNLHGKLVYNPGGVGATSDPQVYKGMSPVCLYPVYLTLKIFSWTGLGTMAFHILLALAVIWGTWNLLGKDNFAMIVAAAAVLCPGYLRWPRLLDPNSLSVLPAIPYAVIVLWMLKRQKFSMAMALALVVLTVAFMSQNWTTAWICAPLLFLFFGMPGVNRRGLIFLFAIMAIGIPLVAVLSFAAKTGTGSNAFNPIKIIEGYTWGNLGYGEGLTTGRAFLRLAFVNGVGLFPVWVIFIYAVARYARSGGPQLLIAFAPLALTIVDVVVMRNYFGHHPWMAGPVLLVGAIFSIALLRVPSVETSKDVSEKISCKWVPISGLACFVYGFAVLLFFRTNEGNLLNLTQLIRGHTARSDTIVVLKKTDPDTAGVTDRLEEPLDRQLIVVDDIKDLPAEKGRLVILSATNLDNSFSLTAQNAAHSKSFLNNVTGWFNRSISRRNPGDRLELPETYYLYTVER